MKKQSLYFTAPGQVETREETLPELGAHDVLVETLCSAISAGTEMLIYQGRFPQDLETDTVISGLRGGFKYPMAYGYASVGIIQEIGKEVKRDWLNRMVFAFQPHTSHFIANTDSVLPVPGSLSHETACFLPNMETAVNLVQDGAPILGERVLVLGQGIIGLLTASLLSEFSLENLITVDPFELRRQMSTIERYANHVTSPTALDSNAADFREQALSHLHQGADLTFELSGNPAALNDAIALTAFSGRIVVGSWYGEKHLEVNLGGTFHRSRIKLISSQVSTVSPELSGRWDKARRFEVAWKALERIKPDKWITHRFALDEAVNAYRLLDESPQETIQVIFDYQ